MGIHLSVRLSVYTFDICCLESFFFVSSCPCRPNSVCLSVSLTIYLSIPVHLLSKSPASQTRYFCSFHYVCLPACLPSCLSVCVSVFFFLSLSLPSFISISFPLSLNHQLLRPLGLSVCLSLSLTL